MQTFLPYVDYAKCAQCLDNKRLPNQVNREVLTLIRGGWPNHPIAKMWKGHEFQLGLYGLACCRELKQRGYKYKKTRKKIIFEMIKALFGLKTTKKPIWMGDERLHSSHRANLLRKDPIYYKQFGWTESPEMPYWWWKE